MNSQENTAAVVTSYTNQKAYTLNPGKNIVTITLISKGASFSDTSLETTISYGSKSSLKSADPFTVYSNGEWVFALVETQYDPVAKPAVTGPSYCHMYFKPGGSASGGGDWFWAIDVQPSDNNTIFVNNNTVQHTNTEIAFQAPTKVNPLGPPSTYPSLNTSVVFLLDKNENGNMLFRGNEPLDTGLRGQRIDFNALHNALKAKYEIQTGLSDFPSMGNYVLRDMAFLDHSPFGELPILIHEIASFGAIDSKQVIETWFPAKPKNFSGMLGQVSNWNVETATTLNTRNVNCVKLLAEGMSTPSKFKNSDGDTIPVIYYIHCSSGHDRTGMISSGYLMKKYGYGLDKSFILGTTIHKLSHAWGGNLVVDCDDISTNNVDPNRSRCFVAGETYNHAVERIYETLTNTTSAHLSPVAKSGDPAINESGTAYVYPSYAWEIMATGVAAWEAGVVLEITILNPGYFYSKAPTVTISAPPNGGTQATATAQINSNGQVINVTMTNQGSGYSEAPQVSFSNPEE